MPHERGECSHGGRRAAAPDRATTSCGRRSRDNADDEMLRQSVSTRRVLRSHYRALKTAFAGSEKEKPGRVELKEFDAFVGSIEDLYSKVHRPRELIADVEAIHDVTSALLGCVKGLQKETGPSPGDFVNAIIDGFANEISIDWVKLGAEASAVFSEASGIQTMIGPMEIQPKPRRARASRTRERPSGQRTRPEELAEDGVEETTATDKNMEVMFKILRTCKRVRLDALVLNRESFAQSVENIFAFSFLVKDGRAELNFDEQGNPVALPRNAPAGQDRQSGTVFNSAFVFRFDYKDWKFMLETVEPGQELMPHRGGMASSPPRASVTPIRRTSRNRARETSSIVEEQGVDEAEPLQKRSRS